MVHGTTINKITNISELLERAASVFLTKCHPLEVINTSALTNLVYDDVYNYALPYNFGSIIDLIPGADRQSWDRAVRNKAGEFDLQKAVKSKTLSIEAENGTKYARINWKAKKGKLLHNMNSLTDNGTWAASVSAYDVFVDNIYYKTGSGAIRFSISTTSGGIQNTTMDPLDLTDEDGAADIFVWLYFPSTNLITNAAIRFGNDLTANYWSPTAQTTQADGTAFKTGWNLLKFSWSTATETGTVDPATIDSFRILLAVTGGLEQIRVDNIIFTTGRQFDIKHYSKYLFKSATTGLWISIPASDDDTVMIDNDTLGIFLMETLIEIAQQLRGKDATFDLNHAMARLQALYPAYKGLNPSMAKKAVSQYSSQPFRNRGRFINR